MSFCSVTLCHGTLVQGTVGQSPPPHSPAASPLCAKPPESKRFNAQCVFIKLHVGHRLLSSVQYVQYCSPVAHLRLFWQCDTTLLFKQCHQAQIHVQLSYMANKVSLLPIQKTSYPLRHLVSQVIFQLSALLSLHCRCKVSCWGARDHNCPQSNCAESVTFTLN